MKILIVSLTEIFRGREIFMQIIKRGISLPPEILVARPYVKERNMNEKHSKLKLFQFRRGKVIGSRKFVGRTRSVHSGFRIMLNIVSLAYIAKMNFTVGPFAKSPLCDLILKGPTI